MSAAAYNRNRESFEPFSYISIIKQLSILDLVWLKELSLGKTAKELTNAGAGYKNRLQSIRHFLGAKTTTHAVAEAIRRKIIT